MTPAKGLSPEFQFASWRVPQFARTIEYPLEVMEEIRAFGDCCWLSHGGDEVGVLFGTRRDDLLRILTWRPIACEHNDGDPEVVLQRPHESGGAVGSSAANSGFERSPAARLVRVAFARRCRIVGFRFGNLHRILSGAIAGGVSDLSGRRRACARGFLRARSRWQGAGGSKLSIFRSGTDTLRAYAGQRRPASHAGCRTAGAIRSLATSSSATAGCEAVADANSGATSASPTVPHRPSGAEKAHSCLGTTGAGLHNTQLSHRGETSGAGALAVGYTDPAGGGHRGVHALSATFSRAPR